MTDTYRGTLTLRGARREEAPEGGGGSRGRHCAAPTNVVKLFCMSIIGGRSWHTAEKSHDCYVPHRQLTRRPNTSEHLRLRTKSHTHCPATIAIASFVNSVAERETEIEQRGGRVGGLALTTSIMSPVAGLSADWSWRPRMRRAASGCVLRSSPATQHACHSTLIHSPQPS